MCSRSFSIESRFRSDNRQSGSYFFCNISCANGRANRIRPTRSQPCAVLYSTSYASLCHCSGCGIGHANGRAATQAISGARRRSHSDPLAARICRGAARDGDLCGRAQAGDGACRGADGRVRIQSQVHVVEGGDNRQESVPTHWTRCLPNPTTSCWSTTRSGR